MPLRSFTSTDVRRIILEQSYRAHIGHIGCCLGIADLLTVLYRDIMNLSPKDKDRDRFILSKGHAALALYATLHAKGILNANMLATFHENNTVLGIHPEAGYDQIELATGSLGHGLSSAAGMALGAKLIGSPSRTYTLMSDAECNEGSVWESIAFAAHHKLNNLTVVLDLDGQQGFGFTHEVIDLAPMDKKWQTFGWHVTLVDGHNIKELTKAFQDTSPTKPHIIIAKTVLGKGVSYMEGLIDWHYLPMTPEQYEQALKEISAAPKNNV